RPGPQPVAERERHVVFTHDVANLIEPLVKETLLVTRQAPLGHDRTAARNDTGNAVGGEMDVAEPHAGVDGEVIYALFALLNQRVAINLPVELHRVAVDFLKRLVDRHGADRDRRVADYPFARVVDVAAGRQVHHGVGAPADRPHHLFDLFFNRRGHGRVADIG